MSRPCVPHVSFSDFLSPDPHIQRRFVQALGHSLEQFGFVTVSEHGVPDALITQTYQVAAEVFALPEPVKRHYEHPEIGRQRGYTPFGTERAKDQSVADLKEFWHVGRTVPSGGAIPETGVPQNSFPNEIPQFETTTLALFAALEHFALSLLDAVGLYLDLPPRFFRELVHAGNSVLRIIQYPELVGDLPVGAVRAAAHEDINLMTVLPASTRPGLELLTRDGQWLAVSPPPGSMICDTGDMMALLTADRLPATTHRVVNPEGFSDGGRMSMPFFVHPHPNAQLVPLWGDKTGAILAKDFLAQRLRDNGVA